MNDEGPEDDRSVSDFGISEGARRLGRGAAHPHDPRFELAAAIRRLTLLTVTGALEDPEINEAAGALSKIASDLEKRAGSGRRRRHEPDPAGSPQDFFPTSPVIGFANPIAPPVVVEATETGLIGRAWFDYPYEGPPGCVHGGIIAMVFDEILGAANIITGSPAMTGTLTIRYRKPTPLRTTLSLEASTVKRDGRKVTTRGAIYCDDTLTAEAEGIFIQLVPERFIEIVSHGADPAEVLERVRADAERLGFVPPGMSAAQDPVK